MNATWKLAGCAALASIGLAAGGVSAGITPIGVFAGQYQESFENFNYSWTSGNVPVFSGLASAHEKSNGSLIITGSWYFTGTVKPNDGSRFMGSPGSWVQYNFNAPIASFGGFFTTNSSVADGRAEFFLDGRLLATQPIIAPKNGVWAWNGWTSSTGFDAVRITSNYSSGGFMMQDSLQATSIPVPGAALAGGLVALAMLRRRR